MLPHVDYCSVLISPHKITEIALLESVQRSITSKITVYKDLDYHQRLKVLKLYSLQRRRERYSIIYTWKIMERLCPNLPQNPIITYEHTRKGRLCKVPPLNTKSTLKIQSIKENTLAVRGPKLFNILPRTIRDKSDASVDSFKHILDNFLTQIPDEPPVDGYYRIENSLLKRPLTGLSSA